MLFPAQHPGLDALFLEAALQAEPTSRRPQGPFVAALVGLALVAAPPAFAEVLDIPPATTKMGGLLEKYADVARGARKL